MPSRLGRGLLLSTLACGCQSSGGGPTDSSPVSQTLDSLGPPCRVTQLPNGDETWEYYWYRPEEHRGGKFFPFKSVLLEDARGEGIDRSFPMEGAWVLTVRNGRVIESRDVTFPTPIRRRDLQFSP